MQETRTPWEIRLDWTLSALNWGALALGVFISGLSAGATPSVTLAALLAGTYVVAMQAMPRRIRDTQWVGEIMAVAGVVATLLAVALTDGIDSPYVLLLASPSFYAGAFLGLRIGLEVALLSATGLIAVVGALEQVLLQGPVFQAIALFVLMAVTFSQARRILVEERERSAALEEATALTRARVERMQAAHNLLTSLSELANEAELNPVTVGEAALRDLAAVLPITGGEVALQDENGLLVVARRGAPGLAEDAEVFPMDIGGRGIGRISLWAAPEMRTDELHETVDVAIRPVTLAFDNILLLQQIARRAVHEERTRVARELHDEIGPSLASLGLALDMAILQYDTDPDLAVHLESTRRHLSSLVENIRRTVADLRHDEVDSIVEQAHRIAAEIGPDGPAVVVEINEHRPPRPAVANHVGAVLTEAVRNAVGHSEARVVKLEGSIDRDAGWVTVSDDGKGFDTNLQPDGRFGLVGMRERAATIAGTLVVDSQPGQGTSVKLEWQG